MYSQLGEMHGITGEPMLRRCMYPHVSERLPPMTFMTNYNHNTILSVQATQCSYMNKNKSMHGIISVLL